VGLIVHEPTPFRSQSIRDNVLAGLKLAGLSKASSSFEIVENCLAAVGLWEEVKGQLGSPAGALTRGQQQRLCIARALALGPQVLLLDEPCSLLDSIATAQVEDVLHDLAATVTIVLATHSYQQAARVSEHTIFMLHGTVVEQGPSSRVFTAPEDPRTEAYITGHA
jgi:phosphate transport system ATP-binding protein